MHQSRPRKPRFNPVGDASCLALTERDIQILLLVSRYRFIQSHHLTSLISGSRQHLLRRLARLFHAGLLARPKSQLWIRDAIGRTFAYCLTAKGHQIAKQRARFPLAPVPRIEATTLALSLAHSLRVTDVVVIMEAATLKGQGAFLPLHEWPSPAVADRRHQSLKWLVSLPSNALPLKTLVIPDGAFALKGASDDIRYFILEVDRGSMPVVRSSSLQSSFQRKIVSYKETRRQGILWSKLKVPAFRVLVIAESERRLASLRQAVAGCFTRGESEMFLFAVASELVAKEDTLGHLWKTCSGKQVLLLG